MAERWEKEETLGRRGEEEGSPVRLEEVVSRRVEEGAILASLEAEEAPF